MPLIKPLLKKLTQLLVPRKLAFVTFTYQLTGNHQKGEHKTFSVLARIKPGASTNDLQQLFTVKAPRNRSITNLKIIVQVVTKLPII